MLPEPRSNQQANNSPTNAEAVPLTPIQMLQLIHALTDAPDVGDQHLPKALMRQDTNQ